METTSIRYCSCWIEVRKEMKLEMKFCFVLFCFSGVGKSTFINCLRGLEAEDECAANVGVVETTNEPTPYEHPDFSNLKIWDLPGR